MPITILTAKQGSEEWHRQRENKVTGSISDVLLSRGLDEALKENLKQFNGNYFTKRGHILEDEAVELYNAIYEVAIKRVGMVRNSLYPNARCSPDGLLPEILIEVKCFNEKNHSAIQTAKDIPFKIMSQLQFNMMICSLKRAHLVLYNPDIEDDEQAFRVIEVKAMPAIQKNMRAKLKGKA